MAHDLIFGRTRRNWSRGSCSPRTELTDEVDFLLTPTEMAMLADLAATKMRADAGDRLAKKKVADFSRKVAGLRAKSKRGDVSASRALRVLSESGVFRGTQSFSLGGDVVIPNITYRAAVLRQANKVAGRARPSTKDFYRAKSQVDKVMGKAGISLFLPGSREGRVTA
jgi:hypothetical protein